MTEKVGVFLCECGPNIKEALHFDDLVEFAKTLPHVAAVRGYRLFCAAEGQTLMADDIKKDNLTRVVFAGCSPREHEHTFRAVLGRAGLNPFHLQVANIREQCAWVIKDKDKATAHAKDIVAAAVERVVRHAALTPREIPVNPDVLVVGAGAAGLAAALTLAQKARRVYVVEKLPGIGGKVVRYGELAPKLECAPCVLEPKMDAVLHNEKITLMTHAEVKEVVGYFGNFTVKVEKKARYVDLVACIGCGACLEPCPVRVPNEQSGGFEKRGAIYYPFKGALPNVPVIDMESCVRSKGENCTVCADNCAFGALKFDDKSEIVSLNVGAVVLATGFELFDAKRAPQFGYGTLPDVYTQLEMEYLISKNGCTSGQVVTRAGTPPKKIALLHCVGSKSPKYRNYCSGVCCLESLKIAHLLKKQLPDADITAVTQDLCLADKDAFAFLEKVKKDGVKFARVERPDDLKVESNGNGMVVSSPEWKTALSGFDMVVLGTALEGARDNRELARIFDVSVDDANFFVEAHGKLDPAATTTDGIFVAGAAQWPKSIEGAVAQGQATAGKILQRLLPGETLTLDPCVAAVNINECSGCKMCLPLCPYHAIRYDGDAKRATISDVLCKGCGVCVASCPSSAITSHHFTDAQIMAEVKSFLAQ